MGFTKLLGLVSTAADGHVCYQMEKAYLKMKLFQRKQKQVERNILVPCFRHTRGQYSSLIFKLQEPIIFHFYLS